MARRTTRMDDPAQRHVRRGVIALLSMAIVAFVVSLVVLDIQAAAAACTVAEGNWSKAQQDAVHELYRYAQTGDRATCARARERLQVPLGDHQARRARSIHFGAQCRRRHRRSLSPRSGAAAPDWSEPGKPRDSRFLRGDAQSVWFRWTASPFRPTSAEPHDVLMIVEDISEARQHTLCFIDLDQFKLINDNFGHAVGDQMLCQFARRIPLQLQPDDLLGRLGGDELAVLMRHTSVDAGMDRYRCGNAQTTSLEKTAPPICRPIHSWPIDARHSRGAGAFRVRPSTRDCDQRPWRGTVRRRRRA